MASKKQQLTKTKCKPKSIKKPIKLSSIELFKKLSKCDEKTCTSRIVNVNEFIGDYKSLEFGNGGDWCRTSLMKNKNIKLVRIKQNGKVEYTWEPDKEEKKIIEEEIKKECKITKGLRIQYIKLCGWQDKAINRSIRKDISNHYTKSPDARCVSCGSNSDLECDHKNDLYNEPRVCNTKTQTLDDFQTLCRHCNQQKRQVSVKTKETNKRYGATNIPSLKPFGIDFISGDETFDPNDINAMKGTYWYDPIEFNKQLKIKLSTK